MKFQDSSFNGLKVTVGTKSVTHAHTHPRTHARSKSNMPHQLFQSWGHKNITSLPTLLQSETIYHALRIKIRKSKASNRINNQSRTNGPINAHLTIAQV